MLVTSFDVETTKDTDDSPMPYSGANKLVCAGYVTSDGRREVLALNHPEVTDTRGNYEKIQTILDETELLVGHNLKFDMIWLKECGFKYDGRIWDTQLYEYLASKSLLKMPSLEESCERHGLPRKTDVLKDYFARGYNTDEIPWALLSEYNLNDVDIAYALFKAQLKQHKTDELLSKLRPTINLVNEFLPVLVDMETNGIAIDRTELERVGTQFKRELDQTEAKLYELASGVMGDTPVNLNSQEHLSWLLYSRRVRNKNEWKEIFNIGSEMRGGVKKPKRRAWMADTKFRDIVKSRCETLYRTESVHCHPCGGTGRIDKLTKAGTPFKNPPKCRDCDGEGVRYISTGKVAGFKLKPMDYKSTSVHGFQTSKEIIEEFLAKPDLPLEAREFLTLLTRYSALSSYLSTFVGGIRNNVLDNGMLHSSFNQCSTVTGRLSSTEPNLQNFPRERTFPIRGVFTSRWANQGGLLLDVDFSTLEFIVAGLVSNDAQIFEDIRNKVDVHTNTKIALTKAGHRWESPNEKDWRQEAKPETFKPVYGGQYGTEAQMAYYKWFREHYNGLAKYQEDLANYVMQHKHMISPSGRIYGFPYIQRMKNGSVNQFQQICNYNIQGFATGDIVPAVMIEVHRLMRDYKVKSLLVLTVHDSFTIDVYPGERDVVVKLVREAFELVPDILKRRYNVVSPLPFGYEMMIGKNLLSKEKVA